MSRSTQKKKVLNLQMLPVYFSQTQVNFFFFCLISQTNKCWVYHLSYLDLTTHDHYTTHILISNIKNGLISDPTWSQSTWWKDLFQNVAWGKCHLHYGKSKARKKATTCSPLKTTQNPLIIDNINMKKQQKN